MVLIKFLLIAFCAYWLLKSIGRFLLSVVLPGYIKKKANQHAQGYSQQRPKQKRPADGNVNIDYVPNEKKKPKTDKGGDFVDYEEVK
ncbi:MAG: DUF4834 family protein [Cyclobacteriaceae bacterium]